MKVSGNYSGQNALETPDHVRLFFDRQDTKIATSWEVPPMTSCPADEASAISSDTSVRIRLGWEART